MENICSSCWLFDDLEMRMINPTELLTAPAPEKNEALLFWYFVSPWNSIELLINQAENNKMLFKYTLLYLPCYYMPS